MNNLKMRSFVYTLTSFVSIVYILCAAFILIAGEKAVKFFNLFFHGADLTKIMKTPTISEIAMGLLLTIVITAAFSALFVMLWNKFNEEETR